RRRNDSTCKLCRSDRCCISPGNSVAANPRTRSESGLWSPSVGHGPTWPLSVRGAAAWLAGRRCDAVAALLHGFHSTKFFLVPLRGTGELSLHYHHCDLFGRKAR